MRLGRFGKLRKERCYTIALKIHALINYQFKKIVLHCIFLEDPYFMSFDIWPWSTYPSYNYGGFYMISGAAIRKLLVATLSVPYIQFEDLYLIGLCARLARVQIMVSDR